MFDHYLVLQLCYMINMGKYLFTFGLTITIAFGYVK